MVSCDGVKYCQLSFLRKLVLLFILQVFCKELGNQEFQITLTREGCAQLHIINN